MPNNRMWNASIIINVLGLFSANHKLAASQGESWWTWVLQKRRESLGAYYAQLATKLISSHQQLPRNLTNRAQWSI